MDTACLAQPMDSKENSSPGLQVSPQTPAFSPSRVAEKCNGELYTYGSGTRQRRNREGRSGSGFPFPLMTVKLEPAPLRPLRKSRRKGRNGRGVGVEGVCRWVEKRQIGLSLSCLSLLALVHVYFLDAAAFTRKFTTLSYYHNKTGKYGAGWDDAYMVVFWVVCFTGLRAGVMEYFLDPFALKRGIKLKSTRVRFAEQAWLFIYYSVFWTVGMYLYITSPYFLNLHELWTHWPSRSISGLLKWYILVQYAFWLQQIFVLQIEKRRKDYTQMLMHHFVTTGLIFTSYAYHQTKVANLILCVMDVVDIFLPVAKCLKYLGYTTLCDYIFGLFMLAWVVARHGLYLMICYSAWKHSPSLIPSGCFSGASEALVGPFASPDSFATYLTPFYDSKGVICWDARIQWAFISALLFLQGITLVWFWMILRIAVKVLRGERAEDVRSDCEEDEDGESDELEVEVFRRGWRRSSEDRFEAAKLEGRRFGESRRRRSRMASGSNGVAFVGVGDKKELLGRIGCCESA